MIKTHEYRKQFHIFLGLISALLLLAVLRWPLLDVPFERDEGEYVYQAQLILQGYTPFDVAYSSQKLPTIYLIIAAIVRLFGDSPVGVHTGLLIVSAVSTCLIYLIAREMYGLLAASAAALSFAILNSSPSVLGFATHLTHFVVLFVLLGYYVLRISHARRRLRGIAGSGFLFGIAIIIRQPAIFFLILGVTSLVVASKNERDERAHSFWIRTVVFLSASITPFLMLLFWMWQAGVFQRFFLWTFEYARNYSTTLDVWTGIAVLITIGPKVIGHTWPIIGIATAGLLQAIVIRCDRNIELIIWYITAWLAVAAGLYFREHYFIQLLPPISLLFGYCVRELHRKAVLIEMPLVRYFCLALGPVAIASTAVAQSASIWKLTGSEISRAVYGLNPFPEAVMIGNYIAERTSPDDTILVLGSEPEIYVYAKRRAANGYYIVYPLTEPTPLADTMQQEFVETAEKNKPLYIVDVNIGTSWFYRPESSRRVFTWKEIYLRINYDEELRIQLDHQKTVIDYNPSEGGNVSENVVSVFKRRQP